MKILSIIKNKKAVSLGGWTEVAIFVSLFVLLFVAFIANMNSIYNKNIDGTLGLNDVASTTQGSLSEYQNTLQQNVRTGTSSSSGTGVSLSTTWGIIRAGANIMWDFVSGQYMYILCTDLLELPEVVGRMLQILFVLSIGFIIIKLVTKIKP